MAKNRLDLDNFTNAAAILFGVGIILLVIFITREENPEPVEAKEDWATIEDKEKKCNLLIEMIKDIYATTKPTVDEFLGTSCSFLVKSEEEFLFIYHKPNNCNKVIGVIFKSYKAYPQDLIVAKDIYEVVSQQWNQKDGKIETFYQLDKLNTTIEKQTPGYLNFYVD